MGEELHPQRKLAKGDASVDEELVKVIGRLYDAGIDTYESCQNYGEYLRSVGLEHIHESKRSYAYIEFSEYDEAEEFLAVVMGATGFAHPLHQKITNEGTPGAWELRARPSKPGHFWVFFPSTDIKALEVALNA